MDTHVSTWPETALDDIPGIVARLAANAPNIARTTAAERVAKLRLLYQVVFDHRAEIAEAGFEELGMNGMLHLLPLKDEIEYVCAHLESWMRDEEVEPVPALMGRRGLYKI
ncbi:MAG: hypothetical protein WDN04_25145 [Rhodospirillales bacterium]